MSIFLTGSTGYIGAHVAANLLNAGQDLNLLVRAASPDDAEARLWRALQLHFDFQQFYEHLRSRIRVFRGDITQERFGLDADDYDRLVRSTTSIIHCAASLNRRSERSCLNVNLRGTLEVLQCARRADEHHGLRRFSHVSTVAVAGERQNELVGEDDAIDWERRDYDPYARTKKFCEHMVRQVLPEGVSHLVFRPSIVLGDSRHCETTQFEMVRSFVFLARLPVLPFRPSDRVDIVPVEFVADSIATLHCKESPRFDVYHLSSGAASQTFRDLTQALARARGSRDPVYWPALERPFTRVVHSLANRRGTAVGHAASLLKVFLPYLYWNTVFDNTRVVSELGRAPEPFSRYSYPLFKYSTETNFTYQYRDWPTMARGSAA
jgi:thioester reductase-like protein